ncbi:NAD(P)-binding protein [Daedalea quercina L-15889]|uniref:NAD(P)-binding protein n=1 Tax=Daedalea quercina L-15889 TaxID=1314783 RepID=A0A165R6Q2_9APHY|nr:NAD(P)-binding protein [Daedalea quercina L-15889]
MTLSLTTATQMWGPAVFIVFFVGAIVIVIQAFHFLQFLWFYLFEPSSVRSYLHGPAPYALVTGATDGIGKAVAQELFAKGFNLIIHGRNEAKIQKVVEELKAQGRGDIRYFIADATKSGYNFDQLLEPFHDLHITIVIHNVGGNYMNEGKIDDYSAAELVELVNWNVTFHLLLTRALLPQLRTTAVHGPVIVEFVGSQVADGPMPSMVVYAATKAFLRILARGLNTEERFWGTPSGVRFAYLAVGGVSSAGNPLTVSATQPTAADFGKALVEKIGSSRWNYAPYLPHAIMGSVASWFSDSMVDRFVLGLTKQMHEDRQKKRLHS